MTDNEEQTAQDLVEMENLLAIGDSTIRQYLDLLNRLHLVNPFMSTEQAAGLVVSGTAGLGEEQLRFLFALAVVRLSDREMYPNGEGGSW